MESEAVASWKLSVAESEVSHGLGSRRRHFAGMKFQLVDIGKAKIGSEIHSYIADGRNWRCSISFPLQGANVSPKGYPLSACSDQTKLTRCIAGYMSIAGNPTFLHVGGLAARHHGR